MEKMLLVFNFLQLLVIHDSPNRKAIFQIQTFSKNVTSILLSQVMLCIKT